MKAIIKYRGGKSKEIPHILWHIPRFTGRYVEPFFGGGALFFHLEPRQAIINDINTPLMRFYQGVRDDFERVRNELDVLKQQYAMNRADFDALKKEHPDERVEDKNEALYYAIRDMFNGKKTKMYSDSAIYYFINKTAYSGMIRYNAQGEFNVPFGRYQHLNTDNVSLSHSLLLRRAQLFNEDYKRIFDICRSDDFVFLDPPYDCIFSDYGNEEYKNGFDEDCHRRLAEDFRNLPCKALMVIGRTPLTEDLYGKYIVDEYGKNYAVNIRNRFKSAARHIIVANYRKDGKDSNVGQGTRKYKEMPEIAQMMLFEKTEVYGKFEK